MKSRKIIAIFTVLLMLINIVPLTAFASEGTGEPIKREVIVHSIPYIQEGPDNLANFDIVFDVKNMDANEVTIAGSNPTVTVNLTSSMGSEVYKPVLSIVSNESNHTITATFLNIPATEYNLNIDIRNIYGYYGRGNYLIIDSYEKTPVITEISPKYIQTTQNEIRVDVRGININKFSNNVKAKLVDKNANIGAESIEIINYGSNSSMTFIMTPNDISLAEGEYKLIIEDGNWDNALRNKNNGLIATNQFFIKEWASTNLIGHNATNFQLAFQVGNINQDTSNITVQLTNDEGNIWTSSNVTTVDFGNGQNEGTLIATFENTTPLSSRNGKLEVIVVQNGSMVLGGTGKSVRLTTSPMIITETKTIPGGLDEYIISLNGWNLDKHSNYNIEIYDDFSAGTKVNGEIKDLSISPNGIKFKFRPEVGLNLYSSYRVKVMTELGHDVGFAQLFIVENNEPTLPHTILRLASVPGIQGQVIEVPVTVENNTGFTGGEFKLHYDTNNLELIEIVQGNLLQGATFQSDINSGIVSFTSTARITNNGKLAIYKFRIKPNAQVTQTMLHLGVATTTQDMILEDMQNGAPVSLDVMMEHGKVTIAVPPPAQTTTQIEVGKAFGLTDSIVEVPVTINNVDKLTGGKIVINFDPGTVYLEEVIPGDLIEEGDLFIHTINQYYYYNQPGRLEIIFASPNAKTGSGEIAKLKFRITGNQTTSISVSAPELELEGDTDIEGQGRIIPATKKDGGITVASLGDVDRNGRITTYDATLILRHVVGLTNLTTEQKIIADVNKDGVIDSGDAILILQYIVGNISF